MGHVWYICNFYFIPFKLNPDHGLSNQLKMAFAIKLANGVCKMPSSVNLRSPYCIFLAANIFKRFKSCLRI